MAAPPTPSKRSRAARIAALARWKGRRILRLDKLSPEKQQIILAIEALEESAEPEAVRDAA